MKSNNLTIKRQALPTPKRKLDTTVHDSEVIWTHVFVLWHLFNKFDLPPSGGACAGLDPEIFYPRSGDSNSVQAKELCANCKILTECRTWGIKHETLGIWGGMSARERQRERKRLGITIETISCHPNIWEA